MTDRIDHLVVALDEDMRDDGIGLARIQQAIEMIGGVSAVMNGLPVGPEAFVERSRINRKLRESYMEWMTMWSAEP